MAEELLRRNNSLSKTNFKDINKLRLNYCQQPSVSLKLIKEIQFSKKKFSLNLSNSLIDAKSKTALKANFKPIMNIKGSIQKAIDNCSLEIDVYKPPKNRKSLEKSSKGNKKAKVTSYANNICYSYKKSSNVYKTLHNGALETIKGGRSKRNDPFRDSNMQYFGSFKPKPKKQNLMNNSLVFSDFQKPLSNTLGKCSSNKQVGEDNCVDRKIRKEHAISEKKAKKLQSERPSQAKNKSKHKRNKSIFASTHEDSQDKKNQEICKRVLETMQRAQSQPKQAKIQMVDDFSEDIQVLAGKIEKEHQKESFRKQFSVSNNINNAQLGNFINSAEGSKKDLVMINEKLENSS